jgi:peptidoglycan biosynthesis protein MviN/MurJ (putative lipid II flippase)
MTEATEERPATFGLIGFILGIASIVVILIQLSAFFEPQEKSTATVIGEIAADIKQSAARALAGKPALQPAPPTQDFGGAITIAALCAAGVAVVLGGIGLYRNEHNRLSYMAVGIGVSALVMQYVFWLAIVICGVALIISIIRNIDSIFS